MTNCAPKTFAESAPLPARFPRPTFAGSATPVFILRVILKSHLNDCVLLGDRP